ncbi:branched-chain amino acid ABC transporter, permease protein [Marvinbryantia formatexigens DSM 14469]|uniref:Branched-chain amino acid ABC transporter, permease protein n=1 Tax=Marvinbryantia formatexigens DSM 14469 TaxID=478749 RepID=C6LB57_9FIRM|nr:sugar ABC transporter permease [Marvinbryantia formatexigens]EET62188.1 branched-chain amino acid ABC transporter, permease protein [Marvinbryantia formatexigens DSM 14469]UWO26477.1 ABC transporter permease [Marvinbryantia formatexigens DSM 14469]SDF79227.1 Branched-chain amino acid transport system / permease component [Marvinbryantia formatexigens]
MKHGTLQYQVKNIIKLISLPLAVFIVMNIVDMTIAGTTTVSSITDLKTLLRTGLTCYCFALALNCNLLSGRMDLSAGAQMFMGCIFGGNLALQLNLGGIGVLIFSMAGGALCGLLVGLLFVNLRILPMVLGLGMTLIFECFSFGAYNQQGLMLYGKQGVAILSDVTFILIVAVLVLAVMTYLFQYSPFGYRRRAIQGNQKLAADAGINIFVNCVVCYVLAGALVACAGVFDTAYKGSLTPVLGMSSNSSVFSNMFPLFLGIYIGGYIGNPILGVLSGSISVRLLILGLSKLSMEGSVQNIIVYSLFLLFMIYKMNVDKLDYLKKKKERIRLAQQTKLYMQN